MESVAKSSRYVFVCVSCAVVWLNIDTEIDRVVLRSEGERDVY